METLIERRSGAALSGLTPPGADTSKIVQAGMLVQAVLGSVGAVEYLKARDIDASIITRVLAGGRVRCNDDLALALALPEPVAS